MTYALATGINTKKLPLRLLLIWALLASVLFSLFSFSHASAATFATEDVSKEVGIKNKVQAVKYWEMLVLCSEKIKTSIPGTDIENGPRWWIESTFEVDLGVYLDTWNDKNGLSGCNGEKDEEPGWISDVFKVFGIPVPTDRNARAEFLEEKLGYTCSASGGTETCTNNQAKSKTDANGWLNNILKASPYLDGKAPSLGSDKNAYTYWVARKAIADINGCKASVDGSSNLILVADVKGDGTQTTSNWSVKNDGGPSRSNWAGIPVDAATTLKSLGGGQRTCAELAKITVDNAEAYKSFLGTSYCENEYPDASNAFIAGCAVGFANSSDYLKCSVATFGAFRQGAPEAVRGCYLGQQLPTNPDGVSSGEICTSLGFATGAELAACIKGSLNQDDPNYCNTAYPFTATPGDFTDYNEIPRDACKEGFALPGLTKSTLDFDRSLGAPSTPPGDATTTCAIDDIGWMVCPLMNAIAGLNDVMYSWIQGILTLNPLQTTDDNGDTTAQYQNWTVVRNIANVLLVVAFLFIIFSQITSIGISNYGVKKMLPRVIMIAIAINLSWFIMALAVDVANVLGIGVNAVLEATAVNATMDNMNSTNIITAFLTGASTITIGTLVGIPVAAAAGLSIGTLALLAAPFLLGAFLSLLAAFVTLFVRNAIIIVLVIIAPVALVAYLLPNTEEWFKKWRKLLFSMLMLFPLAALLFAGAKFAAYIMLTSSQPFAIIAALFVMAAPLGALPWLARSSGGIMAAVGNRLQGAAKFARTSTQKGLSGRVAAQKAEYSAGQRNFLGFKRSAKRVYDPINRTGRMTSAQKWSNTRMTLKGREDNAGKAASASWKELGLKDNTAAGGSRKERRQAQKYSRSSGQISAVLDSGQTIGLRDKASDAAYGARMENRQLNNALEQGITKRLEDAQATSGAFQGRLKQQQLERVRDKATNTAATSIGAAGILNLRDVSQMEFTANAAAKAAETTIQRTNKESGLDEIYIQHQKEDEAGIKLQDTRQEDNFKKRQSLEEPLMKVANQQNAAERSIATTESEEKLRLENVARGSKTLEDLEKRKQSADFAVENIHSAEKGEFEASKLPGGENAKLFAESILGKAASDKTAAEQKRIETEARFGTNQQVLKDDGTTTTLFSKDQISGIVTDDQDTQASSAAAAWAEGGKQVQYATEIDDNTERGRELAVAASGADTRVKNRDGSAIYEAAVDDAGNPIYEKEADGTTDKLDAAGNKTQLQRPKVAKLAQAKAAKVVLEDNESDQNTIVSLARSRSMPNGEALANLGVDIMTGKPPIDPVTKLPLPVPKLTDAEKLGYLRYAAGRGDRQTSMSLVSHVGRLGKKAKEAEKTARNSPTDENIKQATEARQEAKDSQKVLLEAGDSSLPPWLGGSDKQKLAEGNFDLDLEEAAVSAAGSGKLTADAFSAMDINNRDAFVKALEGMKGEELEQIKKDTAKKLMAENGLANAENEIDDTTYEANKAEYIKRVEQNFAQTIIPIDKAQFDVRVNRGLAARDRERYDHMRDTLKTLSGGKKPRVTEPDGTEKDYPGYTPST